MLVIVQDHFVTPMSMSDSRRMYRHTWSR